MNIILASQSPNRQKILKQAGIAFESFSPNIDEASYLKNPQKAGETCLKIAQAKAQKALEKYKDHLIIACDQMAYLKGEFYGKAFTKEQAIKNLMKLQGQKHELITALHMTYKNEEFNHISINKMSMRGLTLEQVKRYVDLDKPLNCAGSYQVESAGALLFEKIESEDFNSIIGLPLIALTNQLIKWDYPLFKK